jgi:Putative ABC-transporter type IV
MTRGKVANFVAETFTWTLLGCFVEVLVTSTVERLSLGDRYVLANVPWESFQGHTTLWCIVDGVALTLALRPLVGWLGARPRFRNSWFWRGIVVAILIYIGEFCGGMVFNKWLGWQLWDYSQYVWHGIPLNVDGQITLVYLPFWMAAGAFLPSVYRLVHGLAPYVGRHGETFVENVRAIIDRARAA